MQQKAVRENAIAKELFMADKQAKEDAIRREEMRAKEFEKKRK